MGLLNPDYFLGGQMRLDDAAGRDAMAAFGTPLEMDADRAAWGVHQIVNENMANAARVHAAERGIDLDGFAMVATGGAGPVHACGVAERLGLATVIVPPAAGVGSAFGLMLAPVSFDYARSYVTRLADADLTRLNAIYEDMERSGRDVVRDAGVERRAAVVSRTADLRYVGQGHEVRVDVPTGILNAASIEAIQNAFDEAYRRLYGRTCEGVPVEAVHWRLNVSGPRPEPGAVRLAGARVSGTAAKGTRAVLLDPETGSAQVAVFDRYGLAAGWEAKGPVIIEEAESTTVVPEAWRVRLHESGALLLRKGSAN
jgi:N-methylhydantoinase A/oxoprolinase/acetone carboxylase beta subunit